MAGVRAILPLSVGILPFGLVYGVVVAESSVDGWTGLLASVLIFAGAAQLSLVESIDANAPWAVAIGTSLVVNARFLLYSAALAPALAAFPRIWRIVLPYAMTDQAATLSLAYFESERDPVRRRWFFLAGGLFFAAAWWLGTAIGLLAGADLPDELELDFAIPLMFLALLVPVLRGSPALVAAAAAVAVTLATSALPDGTNVLCGAVAGVAAGTWRGAR